MMKPDLPQKTPSAMAKLLAGLLGLIVFIALLAGFYQNEAQDWSAAEIEAPTLRDETPPPWREEEGFNLPPAGALPSLQTAMRGNSALRRAVENFVQKDDAEIFANYRKTDADIATILLLWGGADLSATQKTREGQDPRVDMFLRKVYGMGTLEPVINNARLGTNTWPRLFAYYKARLIAQTPGGQAPFNNGIVYDARRDRFTTSGGLSRDFFQSFGAFLRGQRDGAQYRANIMGYLTSVDPPLSAQDRETLKYIQ